MKKILLLLLLPFVFAQANPLDESLMTNPASLKFSPQAPSVLQPDEFVMRVGKSQTGYNYAIGKANSLNGKYYVGLKYPLNRKSMYTVPLFEVPAAQAEMEIDTVYYNGRGMVFVKGRYSACGLDLGGWQCSELQEDTYLARRRALHHMGSQNRALGYTMYVLAGLLAVPGAIVLLGTEEKGAGIALIALGTPFYFFGKYMVSVGASTSYLADATVPNVLPSSFSTLQTSIQLQRSF